MRIRAGFGVLIVAAAFTGVSACSESRPAAVRPAARVIVEAAGVGVTWLPAGYAAGAPVSSVSDDGAATLLDFVGTPASNDKPRPRLTLNISRDKALQLPGDGDGAVKTAVTIHGIHAELISFQHFKGTEGHSASDLFFLTWTEAGAHLSVMGVYGATRSEVEGFAAGLKVESKGDVFASPDAEREIRAAFADAFNGQPTPDPAKALGAVEQGEQLRVAYNRLVTTLPETARTSRVTVQRVSFTAADRASVQFAVSAQFQGRQSDLTVGGQQVFRVNGAWKVSQEAYCQVIRQVGIGCQASPRS